MLIRLRSLSYNKYLPSQAVAVKAQQQLQQEFQPRQTILEGRQAELRLKIQQFEKNQLTLSQAQVKASQQEIQQLQQQLQQLDVQIRQDFNQAQEQRMKPIEELIEQVIAEVAKDLGFDLVVYQGVAYFDPSLDITAKVLEKLNEQDLNEQDDAAAE